MGSEFLPDGIIRHAGLVMAHAATIASVLKPGELICPFALIAKGENRQSIEFEAPTQDEAVSQGWESLERYKEDFDLWAFAREGLAEGEHRKDDVLLAAAWSHGMAEPVVFTQCFIPANKGGFALVGPVAILGKNHEADLERIKQMFNEGIMEHPKGNRWASWHGD
ncbi:MAG TPA: hypothetical protein VJ727_04410 [Rhodanobacteraceae bacterium]|nr:hypothetical protein [Rhodanobacteraceae bacterium]